MARVVRLGDVLLDVGANVGMYSIFAAKVSGATVHRVRAGVAELRGPQPATSTLNQLDKTVAAYCVALSDRVGFDRLYLSEFVAGSSLPQLGSAARLPQPPARLAASRRAASRPRSTRRSRAARSRCRRTSRSTSTASSTRCSRARARRFAIRRSAPSWPKSTPPRRALADRRSDARARASTTRRTRSSARSATRALSRAWGTMSFDAENHVLYRIANAPLLATRFRTSTSTTSSPRTSIGICAPGCPRRALHPARRDRQRAKGRLPGALRLLGARRRGTRGDRGSAGSFWAELNRWLMSERFAQLVPRQIPRRHRRPLRRGCRAQYRRPTPGWCAISPVTPSPRTPTRPVSSSRCSSTCRADDG